MKNQFLFIIIFSLISTFSCSMDSNFLKTFDGTKIELNTSSQANLIERGKAENISRGYWPENVAVTLQGLYLLKDQYKCTENPRYTVPE